MIKENKKDIVTIWTITILLCLCYIFTTGELHILNILAIVLIFCATVIVHEYLHAAAVKVLHGNPTVCFTRRTALVLVAYNKFDTIIVSKAQVVLIFLTPQALTVLYLLVGILSRLHSVFYTSSVLSLGGSAADFYYTYKIVRLPKGKLKINTDSAELIKENHKGHQKGVISN